MTDRREFLKTGSLGVLALKLGTPAASPHSEVLPILSAHLGEPITYGDSFGDVWSTTWADDNYLYSVSDDTNGFKNACDSNLAINRISGEMPPDLEGTTINPMSDYGKMVGIAPLDGGNWKAGGLTCVEGVLYLAVCRNLYGGRAYVRDPRGPDYWIQEAWDASIIKSVDHGKTWSSAPKIDQAMFPGRNFSFPCFVEYGKNGAGHKDEFVYAVSQDGPWNNASSITLLG